MTINAVIRNEGEWWVAQCLEYDVAVQARTLDDVKYELQKTLVSHIVLSLVNNEVPFAEIPPAPGY